jgi:hypothetical protein
VSEQNQSTEYGGDKDLVDIARESSFALRDTTKWLHRRVERICHTERSMVRRKVSVDFTIPEDLPPFHQSEDDATTPNVYFVPVALLRKWPPLMEFDLRAEDGRPIPLLTTRKNREVDAAALIDLAPEGSERECLRSLLESVAHLDEPGARHSLEAVGTFLDVRWASLPPDDQKAWHRTLRVAGSLVTNSILWVRVEANPGQRQLIKFAFIDPAPKELLLRRRVLSAFSWAPRRAQYLLPNLGERGSYHLEIEVPPDLAIYRAKLELSDLPPLVPQTPPGTKTLSWLKALPEKLALGMRERYRELLDPGRQRRPEDQREVEPGKPYARNVGERAYLYVVGSQDQYGMASVDMGIGNRALITSSWRASLVITALLALLWQAPGSVVHHLDGAVALLVIFPALLALVVVRAGEHPMMRQLIAGVRFLLVGAAMLPVVDALFMLAYAHPRAGDVRTPFLIVFLVGAFVSVLLGTSWLLPGTTDD